MERCAFGTSLFGAILVVAACGPAKPSVMAVVGPDGQAGWLQVNCPHEPKKCREMASDSCPGGYEEQEFKAGSGGSRYSAPSSMDEPIGPPEKRTEMLIMCRSGGSAPRSGSMIP
jgi:hypothetical protein